MPIPISNVTRRVVYAASGTGPYAFTFEILANTDIAVYRDDTLLTLTTDYTVTIAANGTGSITLVAAPTGATQIAIVGNRTIQRTTDFVTGGDFFANTVNDEMDQQTIFAQQNAEGLQRALSAPQTDPTSINMTLPRASLRANKALGFDANGNPAIADTLGTNRGNWSASTLYYVRDIIKDTTNSNIWQCIVQHTSSGSQPIGTNADAAKWTLLVDAAAAATSATNAAASASAASTSASAASSSATAASGSASTASTQASNASTSASNAASSASAASSSASTASTAATNAGNSATAAATSATNASNSASAASTSASNASSSASAASTSASNASTSATNAASSATAASGSASTASTQATNAASSATAAAASESAAASSASSAAASYDSFDDRYLGAKSSNPSVDNDGNALLTGAIYFNSVANTMRVYNGSAWQDQAASPDTIAERSFAATAGQTSYTFTGGYRVGYTYVYVNGALLDTADITATDGTTITFTSALSLNDEVRILSYKAIGSVAIGDISGLQAALDAKVAGAAASATVGGDLKLYEGTNNGTNYTGFKAPASLAANVTYTLPSADGTADQVLKTNGSAVLSWTTPSGGGGSAATPTVEGTVYGKMTSSGASPRLTALGYNAGAATTGVNNVFVGVSAGEANVTGTDSIAIGYQAMQNYSGSDGLNIAIGSYALSTATTGSSYYNVAIGYEAMKLNTSGYNNVAMGWRALLNNTSGRFSVAIGYNALRSLTTGNDGSTAVGASALDQVTTGIYNVGCGGSAIAAVTTGSYNTAMGYNALGPAGTTSSSNTAIGYNAMSAGGVKSNNTAVGREALAANTTGSSQTAVGYLALNSSTGAENTAVGTSAGAGITSGTGNVILGPNSGGTLTTGASNIYVGNAAMASGAAVNKEILIGWNTSGKGSSTGYISPDGGGVYQGNNAATWSVTSDQRLKKNIADNNDGLDKINSIRVRNFEYRLPEEIDSELKASDAIIKSGVQLGVIAQELQAVLPECVKTESTGVMSVDTDNLTWYLVNAVKQLKAEFDAYKASHP